MNVIAIPENSQEPDARKVSSIVIRLGQIGCANNANRLTKPMISPFGSLGRIEIAANGPSKIEHHKLNNSKERVDALMATSIQSPVAITNKETAERTKTRQRAGSDE